MTQLICDRTSECGKQCVHSEPHEPLISRGRNERVNYCEAHHCLWWTRRIGRRHEKVQCEEAESETQAG